MSSALIYCQLLTSLFTLLLLLWLNPLFLFHIFLRLDESQSPTVTLPHFCLLYISLCHSLPLCSCVDPINIFMFFLCSFPSLIFLFCSSPLCFCLFAWAVFHYFFCHVCVRPSSLPFNLSHAQAGSHWLLLEL